VRYTLLLADDSVTIQRVIELTFADEDVTVVAVSDGDQAIERLEASPPDIVLADIGMPGKNGYEVAQYIRQSPRLSHIPVVLLTGAFEPVDQARANEAGCDGVLAKPFEPQLVISRVKELLARPSRGAGAPDSGAGAAPATGGDVAPPRPATPAAGSIWASMTTDQRPVTPFVDPPIAGSQTGPAARTELNDYFDRLDAAFSSLPSNSASSTAPPVVAIPDPVTPSAATDIDWFGNKESESGSTEPWDLPVPQAADIPSVDLEMSYASATPDTVRDLFEPNVLEPNASQTAAEPASGTTRFAAPDERLAPIEESAPIEPDTARVEPAKVFAPAEPIAPAASVAPGASAAAPPPALEIPLSNPPPLPALADAFAALLAAEQGETVSSATGIWPATPPAAAPVGDELIEEVTRRVLDRLSDTSFRDTVADIASKVAERLVREEIERIKASIK
jgi:CheY-like chemotaxis protein